MNRKLYSADELMHTLENTSLESLNDKIRATTNDEWDQRTWNTLYDLVLQQRQKQIMKQDKFIR